MKNKFKTYIVFLIVCFVNINTIIFANDFIFDGAEIKITEKGNIIQSSNGNAKTLDGTIEIIAKNFIYIKDKAILTATGDVFLKDFTNNITLRSKKIIFDESKAIITATGNVYLKDSLNNITMKSQTIISNRIDRTIQSNTDSVLEDKLSNSFFTKKFLFTQNDRLIKINNAKLIDSENNTYNILNAFIDLDSNKLIGKDISIDFNNLYFEKDNEPRLKGKIISSNKNQTTITKGVFTTCKKNDDCPPWQLFAKEIKHDKNKKMIFYKNAWLKLYDKPVFYFPKFFHPDPTVKRQSGFLMPSLTNSTSTGSSLNTPYYQVISDNKDLTLKPRLYANNKFLLASEFRQVGKASKNLADASYLIEQNASSKGHFFSKNNTKLDLNAFSEAELSIQLQQVSSDTYLKSYKLKSPLINNESILDSSINFNAYNESLSLETSAQVFEDLNKKTSDRYQFIYPSYKLTKKFDENLTTHGQVSLESSGFIKNYDTNVYEQTNINNLIFNTNYKITNNGLKNNLNFLIKNVNSNAQKSEKYKNKNSNHMASIMQYNVSYPLIKEVNGNTNKINPKMVLKFSPSHTKKSIDKKDNRIDMNNVYSIDRIGNNDTVEGGTSLTLGSDFIKSNDADKDIFKTSIASVFRFEENDKLPTQNALGEKTSDIIGNIEYSPNDKLNLGYDYSLDSNLNNFNYQEFNTEFKINNFVTSFEFLNENKSQNRTNYISNRTSYALGDNNNFSFETRNNKKTNMTEFYNLIYQYRNDCLIAAIEYNKDYYTDRDLQPDESFFFKLTIIPFGEASLPGFSQ
jgi:LPS-assembly protein